MRSPEALQQGRTVASAFASSVAFTAEVNRHLYQVHAPATGNCPWSSKVKPRNMQASEITSQNKPLPQKLTIVYFVTVVWS